VVLAIWIALALAAAAVALRRARSLPRIGISTAAVALSAWLTWGLAGHALGDLDAFLPLPAAAELRWRLNDYDGALALPSHGDGPVYDRQ
jgi:hypothetical protein